MEEISQQGRGRGWWVPLVVVLVAGLAVAGWWVASRSAAAEYRERIAPWQPVVTALEAYVAEQGGPPAKLADLVPRYLAASELPSLPAASYRPQPYETTPTGYRIIISASGGRDYLTHESDRPGWYYFDDSNAPERLVQPAAGP